jgi:CheY-like chemotaxis protein
MEAAERRQSESQSGETAAPPLVLVVDDDPDIRETLASVLESAGYRVVLAEHGAQALVALHHAIPDAMLVDLLMPVMSGWELLQIIREDERWSKIPVIVLSAVRTPHGFAHLTKPLSIEQLLDTVASVLRRV